MKTLLVYSSKTNNTKKIADVIAKTLSPSMYQTAEETDEEVIQNHDVVVIGGWIDKGTMNKEVIDFMSKVKNKKVAFFFTLGAYPTGMHAIDCIHTIKKDLVSNGNTILGHYHCQGAIDPKLISWMSALPKEHPHSPDEDRLNRWSDARKHPNQEDFNAAKSFVSTILCNLGEAHV